MNVVIVGAVACGAKAASRIKRLNPLAKVILLDRRKAISFAGCGLPYYIGGQVRHLDDLLKTTDGRIRDADYFRELKDIDTRVGVLVEAIDRTARIVRARDIGSGEALEFAYDRLILATGARPARPPIEGLDLPGVWHLTSLDDAAGIAAAVSERKGGSAVIIGAGLIGLEATEALMARGWSVTLVEREAQVLPGIVDHEIAAALQEHLFERNVELKLGARVTALRGEEGRLRAVATTEGELEADLAIVAVGVRPEVELAREAGLEIGATGALRVNARMQTSDPRIYAGGDSVESVHLVSGRPVYAPLGSTANKHGRVIGDNVCGVFSEFPGVLGTFVCKVFDFTIGATGLTERAAHALEYDIVTALAPGFDKAHYYPGASIIGIKLVLDRATGRLLGMQGVGGGDVARRVDVAATALRFGATIDQLADLDLAYAPPYAQAMDAVITAANVARNARDGRLRPVTPADTRQWLAQRDDVLLLDVRGEMEFRRGHIDDAKVVNIPLDQLRARLGELPRDREILTFCVMGLRSFNAQRLLESAGFQRVRTVMGGMWLWPWKDELA